MFLVNNCKHATGSYTCIINVKRIYACIAIHQVHYLQGNCKMCMLYLIMKVSMPCLVLKVATGWKLVGYLARNLTSLASPLICSYQIGIAEMGQKIHYFECCE